MGLKNSKAISLIKRVKWLKILVILFVVIALVGGGVGLYFVYTIHSETESFDVTRLYSTEASKIYDVNGDLVYTYGDDLNGNRTNVTYDELPQVLIDAVVAAEDSRYFEHNGMDIPRLVMAAVTNILTNFESGGGASTITQQIIKLSYNAGIARTIPIKISEMFLAVEATNEASKEEILTLYLNKIYFGRSLSSIGISSASNYYFNKDVSELTLPEAALVAGTLNAPGAYDPYYNIELATQRRNIILDLMLYHGYITEEECELAKAVPVENTLDSTGKSSSANENAAYIDLVDQEIRDLGIDPTETQLNIYTYLDPEKQSDAVNVINDEITFPDEYLQTAVSIQDVDNGRILAVVGGRDYTVFNYNRADVKQQPGSSIKPIIDYAAAYEFLDWSTAHTVEDLEYDKNGYNPGNFNGTSGGVYGQMNISTALFNSWNTCAVWTLDSVISEIGSSGVYNYLDGFNIDMSSESYISMGYAIGGWDGGLSTIESANIYSTISNGGTAYESHTIDYIEFANGEESLMIDEEIQNNASTAISAESAFMLRETMADYMSLGSYGSYLNYGQIRAKTGTTNWGSDNAYGIEAGAGKDLWVASYNPDYAVSVWLGYDYTTLSENPMTTENSYTLRFLIANALWDNLVEDGVENSYPSQPSSLTYGSVVKGLYPYVLPSEDTSEENILSGWFKNGTYPTTSYDSLTCGTLDSFTAVEGNNGIDVEFSQYDPIEATTEQDYDTYTSAFGLVVYSVDVIDPVSGEILHSQSFSSPTGTVNYTPTGDVTVKGYYSYTNANSIRSNEVNVSIITTPFVLDDIHLSATHNGVSFSSGSSIKAGDSVSFSIIPQSEGSYLTFEVYNSSNSLVAETSGRESFSPTFNTAGTYVVHVNETSGSIEAPTSYFTIVVEAIEEDDDDDDSTDDHTDDSLNDNQNNDSSNE